MSAPRPPRGPALSALTYSAKTRCQKAGRAGVGGAAWRQGKAVSSDSARQLVAILRRAFRYGLYQEVPDLCKKLLTGFFSVVILASLTQNNPLKESHMFQILAITVALEIALYIRHTMAGRVYN